MANVAKVGVRYVLEAGDIPPDADGAFTFHVKKTDGAEPWSDDDRADLAARVYQWWADPDAPGITGAEARAHFATYMRIDRIDVWAVEPDPDGPTTLTPTTDDRYGTGSTLLAPQLCHLVSLRTTVESRRYRGRIYWPATENPLGEGRTFGIIFDPTIAELGRLAQNLAACIRGTTFETNPWVLAVYSKIDHDALAVTHFHIPDRLTTQRRRAVPIQFYTPVDLVAGP